MEIRYTPSAKDVTAFQRHWSLRQNKKARKKHWWITLALAVVLLPLVIIFVEELWALDVAGWLLDFLVLLVGLAVLVAIAQVLMARQIAKATAGEMLVGLEEDGLHHDDQVTHSVTDWAALEAVDQGKHHIFISYGYMRGLAIPLKAFADAGATDALLQRLAKFRPDLKTDATKTVAAKSKRKNRRVGAVAVVVVVLVVLCLTSPWRSTEELPDGLGAIGYMTAVTGDADPAARLPLVIDLHPYGGFPAIMKALSYRRDFQARSVYPAGAHWHVIGNSWFGFDEDMDGEARRAADRVAALTRIMMARYPTAGQPIVTGFSQGGSMAYALAAYHPDLFVAAVPVSGAMPGELPERAAAPDIEVRALHGGDDKVVPANWAQYIIEQMQEQGWNAELEIFPEAGHKLPAEAKAAWNRLLADFAAGQASLAD